MARLIDADALEEKMNQRYKVFADELGSHDHYVTGYDDAISDVEIAPTIDAEPVVRCKDCKYARPYDYKYVTCLFHPTFIHYSPVDGYCYLGKKADGGAEE